MMTMLLTRLVLFRKEVAQLWKAFWAPETPFHLKAATLFVAFYLVNPLDILPDTMAGEMVFLPLSDTHVRNQPLKLVSRVTSALDTATSQFVEYLLARLNETIEDMRAAGWQLGPETDVLQPA